MARVVHFEIHASDPEVLVSFYSTVFGWKISKWEGPVEYWIVGTGEGPGIDGGILRRQGAAAYPGAPVNAYVCTVSVASLDQTQAAILDTGGTIAVERDEIPGIGLFAYFNDPDGNMFGVLQPA
jgi:uncharacterized protein